MNKLVSITLAVLLEAGIIISGQQSLSALENNRVPASVAQGKTGETETLSVSPYGIVISFEDLKESVEKYWATDNAYLRVGTNAPLGPDANLLFLKTEGKWPDDKNGTAVTIKTRDASGESRTYSFLIEFTENKPKHSIIRIYPDVVSRPSNPSKVAEVLPTRSAPSVTDDRPAFWKSLSKEILPSPSVSNIPGVNSPIKSVLSRIGSQVTQSASDSETSRSQQQASSEPEPVQPEQQVSQDDNAFFPQASQPLRQVNTAKEKLPDSTKVLTSQPSPSKQHLSAILLSHSQANALVRGLSVANRTGEVGRRSLVAAKIQYVIRRLRSGQDLLEASQQESVPQPTIIRLLQLGNYKDPS